MTITTSAPRNAIFDRLGGFDGVDQAVHRLFDRLAADAALAGLLPTTGLADARWQVQMLLTDRLGGPMAYDGPDPAAIRAHLGIDAAKAGRIETHLLAAFQDGGAAPAAMDELRTVLAGAAGLLGLKPSAESPAAERNPREVLVEQALDDIRQAGLVERPLFVLDTELTLVHLNAEARRGLEAARVDLQRAFGVGAGDLTGQSILRIHPAPSQLQGLLQDISRLPKETTWCFGQAIWKARISAVRSAGGTLLGFGISWRDETDLHRAETVFQRLRTQAEDLPVPIMYPDPKIEKWFGNASCEHALQRLAPYLPFPVNPLDGVPVQLFLPDDAERLALFRDPSRMPHKSQIKMGPETIAILVSPVLDEDQRYLGPQITWEIVHFTRKADQAATQPRMPRPVGAPPPAVPRAAVTPVPAPAPTPPRQAEPASIPVKALRGEARAIEATASDLQTLVRLLDLVADQAEGQGPEAIAVASQVPETGATGQTDAALAAALVAVRHADSEATGALTREAQSFASELQHRVHDTMQRTQLSAEALGKIMTAATGLAELRAALGEPVHEAAATVPGAESRTG